MVYLLIGKGSVFNEKGFLTLGMCNIRHDWRTIELKARKEKKWQISDPFQIDRSNPKAEKSQPSSLSESKENAISWTIVQSVTNSPKNSKQFITKSTFVSDMKFMQSKAEANFLNKKLCLASNKWWRFIIINLSRCQFSYWIILLLTEQTDKKFNIAITIEYSHCLVFVTFYVHPTICWPGQDTNNQALFQPKKSW